jgi:hypothetical protein
MPKWVKMWRPTFFRKGGNLASNFLVKIGQPLLNLNFGICNRIQDGLKKEKSLA